MRVWIYGRSTGEIQSIRSYCMDTGDILAGSSLCGGTAASFPLGGLAQPMQAALRGELDQLLLPDLALLGSTPAQARQMEEAFRSYGVSVRSVRSCGSSSS